MPDNDRRYPLRWPEGWPRTLPADIKAAQFKVTQDQAQREMIAELGRLDAEDVIMSTNVAIRRNGLPFASRRPPDDRGVAVYFTRKGKRQVLACDRYSQIGDNIRAIGKTIEALRGIERWGASDMLDRAFTGFEALPPPEEDAEQWWDVLGIDPGASPEDIRRAYREMSRTAHPNAGGDRKAWDRLSAAYQQAIEERQ